MNLQIAIGKKRSFIFCFLLIFINSSFAQITFQKTYGGAQDDEFYSVQQTTDGGYIAVGYTNSFGAGNSDIYFVKTDISGDTLWTRIFGGTGSDFGYCVQQTTDSGYIIIGKLGATSTETDRIYLIKTDVNGDTIWTKIFKPYSGMGGAPGGLGLYVKQTFDGGYVLDCIGNSEGVQFLIKTDAVGDSLWTKSYRIMSSSSEVQQITDSGYIITGTGDDGANFYYIYLIKTDVNGNSVWKRKYGGNSYGEWSFSVRQTFDGGYIAGGYSNSQGDVYLIKTNSIGDTLWTKAYGGDSVDIGRSIYLTTDSGFVIAGLTQGFAGGNVYLIRTNALGDILWTKSFGGINIEDGYSVNQTSDYGFIVAGTTNSFGAGNYDAYLIKTDANGSSGCYENDEITMQRTTPITVSLPIDTFLLGPIAVNSFSAFVSSGCNASTLCSTTDLSEIATADVISIYPNPAQIRFTISVDKELFNTNLEIYDVFSKNIYSEKLHRKLEIINCNEFPSGIYFITVRTENALITKKLIINK